MLDWSACTNRLCGARRARGVADAGRWTTFPYSFPTIFFSTIFGHSAVAAPSTPPAARRPATPPPTEQSYGDMLGIVVAALAFFVPDAALSARCVRATAVLLQAGKQDPMRPANPPIEPLIINAIQDMLKESKPDANAIAERALAARSADPDYILADGEATLLRTRIAGVAAASDALVALLHAAVDATPWVTKFGAAKDFGVGELSDPYVRVCRAECMLAALLWICESQEVSFIEEDRMKVLQAAPADAVEAVRKAASGRL